MADISASDVGQSGKLFDTATGKIWGAFGAALLVTAVVHTFGGGLGLPMQWLLTVGAFGAAAYFVAQETGRALGGANSGVEATRMRNAMQGATTNVMIADNDFNIVYMNDSMVAMMRNAEADIKKDLPQFNANSLIGTNIDGFHANPALQRGMVGGLTTTFSGRITIGPRTFNLVANPIFDDNRDRLGTSVEWEDVTACLAEEAGAATVAANNARLKAALDGAQTNVMLADNDFNIIYMNETMIAMMNNAESDIKKDLPKFNANKLMGTNIDGFHKDPSHQRTMVGELEATYETSIVVGGRTFNLIANPVLDDSGTRLGTCVEWEDATEKLKAEEALAETAQTNARLKAALDGAKANVMLADNDFNIIYMNETMVAMMKNAEADIKEELPNFDADNLMGFNIDGFH
ncbi:MAG: PAS domain-containing protein, partial [Kordiimonadaceae bacterium]|nr:PAS domain-containing protein [Kordiimonadaceae bacterium]